MGGDLGKIKKQIVSALSHVEAEDGLYFNNLIVVHEEEERPVVNGTEEEVLNALKEMIRDGTVIAEDSGDEVIFRLSNSQ